MKRRVYTDTVAAGIAVIDSEMTAWIEVVSSEEDGESRFVLDGYNVEFQGARPATVAQDY